MFCWSTCRVWGTFHWSCAWHILSSVCGFKLLILPNGSLVGVVRHSSDSLWALFGFMVCLSRSPSGSVNLLRAESGWIKKVVLPPPFFFHPFFFFFFFWKNFKSAEKVENYSEHPIQLFFLIITGLPHLLYSLHVYAFFLHTIYFTPKYFRMCVWRARTLSYITTISLL